MCVRCFSCWDTKEHRLWWCDDNATLLNDLLLAYPSLRIDDLPTCLRRCGLVPSSNFCPILGSSIANFLLATSARATSALANYRRDLDEPVDGFPDPGSSQLRILSYIFIATLLFKFWHFFVYLVYATIRRWLFSIVSSAPFRGAYSCTFLAFGGRLFVHFVSPPMSIELFLCGLLIVQILYFITLGSYDEA